VLRLWGEEDRIVSQRAWAGREYLTRRVLACAIRAAGHFPWIDNPAAVTRAFSGCSSSLRF
jgi:pimeloyl-ACP methyl ester carboxylesterase